VIFCNYKNIDKAKIAICFLLFLFEFLHLAYILLNIILYNLVYFGIGAYYKCILIFISFWLSMNLLVKFYPYMLNLTILFNNIELNKYLNRNLNKRHPFCIHIWNLVKRWYPDLIPCGSNPFPSLLTSFMVRTFIKSLNDKYICNDYFQSIL
jgi:hypothetical protein